MGRKLVDQVVFAKKWGFRAVESIQRVEGTKVREISKISKLPCSLQSAFSDVSRQAKPRSAKKVRRSRCVTPEQFAVMKHKSIWKLKRQEDIIIRSHLVVSFSIYRAISEVFSAAFHAPMILLEFPLYYQGTAVLIYQSKIWRHGIGSIKKLTFVLSLDWFYRKCSWQITILDILGVAIL